jgi:hypothetical protein
MCTLEYRLQSTYVVYIQRYSTSNMHLLCLAVYIYKSIYACISGSGGLAVKRITSNDEIPGSSPGRSSYFSFCSFFCPTPRSLRKSALGNNLGLTFVQCGMTTSMIDGRCRK